VTSLKLNGSSAGALPTPTPPAAQATAIATTRPRSIRTDRRALIIAPLALLCCVWLWALVQTGGVARGPRAVTFGGDFALNMSSAALLKQGGNPYDGNVLLRAEQAYMDRNGIPVQLGADQAPLTWGGYPPLFFWILEPLTSLPFHLVALLWIGLLLAVMIGGFIALLRYLGWKSLVIPSLIFAIMPQTTLEAYYANPTGLVVGLIFLALALQRRHPLSAGLLFSLAFLKPQLAVPTLIAMTVFLVLDRRRFLTGVTLGVCALVGASLATVGPHGLALWVYGLASVSAMVASQPNMAPLIGLYAGWTAQPLRTCIEAVLAMAVLALTAREWYRGRAGSSAPFLAIAWLWVGWFLVLPYARFPDEILLAPAILAFVGPDGRDLGRLAPATMLYLIYFSALLFSAHLAGAQLLSLPLLVLLAVLYVHRSSETRETTRAAVLSA